jgi:hypothetical protein
MKIKEALDIIDEGWVKKSKGFRVHFQKLVNSEVVTDYAPGVDEDPLDSDVAAWRLAWKLSQVAQSEKPEISTSAMVNIYVVDDLGNPVAYYATNQPKVYNSRDI